MAYLCKKVVSKTFAKDTIKDSFLAASKWYAKNVIKNENLIEAMARYVKNKNDNSVTVEVYVATEQSKVMTKHCAICKEMHSKFYINENYNCNKCSINSFQRRINKVMNVKASRYKEVITKDYKSGV